MADTVLSVRIDEELKHRFIELAQENEVNNKDLMQMLLAHFELEQLKEGKMQFSQDIDELQRLTKRIADIYLNMVERVQLQELEQRNKENALVEQVKKENEALQEELKKAKEREKDHQQLKDKLNAMNQEIKKIQEEHQVLKDLNDLLRQKNDQLEKNDAKMTSKLAEADKALDERNKLKAALEGKDSELQRLSFKIDTLEHEKAQQQQKHEKKESESIQKMKEQMDLLKRQQQIELQELKLSLQVEHIERMEKMKSEHEKSINELLMRNEQLQSLIDVAKEQK